MREPDRLEPCPECGAQSAALGYWGHGMHCCRYYRKDGGKNR